MRKEAREESGKGWDGTMEDNNARHVRSTGEGEREEREMDLRERVSPASSIFQPDADLEKGRERKAPGSTARSPSGEESGPGREEETEMEWI